MMVGKDTLTMEVDGHWGRSSHEEADRATTAGVAVVAHCIPPKQRQLATDCHHALHNHHAVPRGRNDPRSIQTLCPILGLTVRGRRPVGPAPGVTVGTAVVLLVPAGLAMCTFVPASVACCTCRTWACEKYPSRYTRYSNHDGGNRESDGGSRRPPCANWTCLTMTSLSCPMICGVSLSDSRSVGLTREERERGARVYVWVYVRA